MSDKQIEFCGDTCNCCACCGGDGFKKESVLQLIEAAKLAVENFNRNRASGNFLGDDDHEVWQALLRALERFPHV